MDIKCYGNSILSKTASRIELITEDTKKLATKMIEAMHEHNGIGLAATQIGVNQRLVIIYIPSDILKMPIVLINPEFTPFGKETTTLEEGCLSIPDIHAPVTRPAIIDLKATKLSNETISIRCVGLLARVLQHEVDHLNGILFVERLNSKEYKKIKYQLEQSRKRGNYEL